MVLMCVIDPGSQYQIGRWCLPGKAVKGVFDRIPIGWQAAVRKLMKLNTRAWEKGVGCCDRLSRSCRIACQGQPVAIYVAASGELKQSSAASDLNIVRVRRKADNRQRSAGQFEAQHEAAFLRGRLRRMWG